MKSQTQWPWMTETPADRTHDTRDTSLAKLVREGGTRGLFKGREVVSLLSGEPEYLDPLKEEVFQECVSELRGRGGTVLLSSHILAQVEQLVDTLTIIRKGKAAESGSLEEMKHLARSRVAATLRSEPDGLELMPGVHEVEIDGMRVRFSVDTDRLEDAMRWLLDRGVEDL